MDFEKESELTAAKKKIQELEAMVASLHGKIQLLESQNHALRVSLCKSEKIDGESWIKTDDKRMDLGKIQAGNLFEAADERTSKQEGKASGISNDLPLLSFHATETDQSRTACPESILLRTTTKAKMKKGDISSHSRRHVALKIMYLGARYHGFASEASTQKTVESELFGALEKTKLLMGRRVEERYSRCGRTDKGVSANDQVIALLLRSCQKDTDPPGCFVPVQHGDGYPSNTAGEDRVAAAKASRSQEAHFATAQDGKEIDYVGVLNRALPSDIRVLGWCYVPYNFHARFSCVSREYKYFFINNGLDIEAMRAAACKLEGEHDFRNFCKMDAENVHNFKRKIISFDIVPCTDRWAGYEVWMFRVKGTAFLWHQVRCMVAVLLMIGERKESPLVVEELLDVQKTVRKPQYIMAPHTSLVLQSCKFEGLSFSCSPSSGRLLYMHLEKQLKEHLLAAAMLKEAYDQLPFCSDSDLPRKGLHKKILHIPLSCRPTEPSYEERCSKLQHRNLKVPLL